MNGLLYAVLFLLVGGAGAGWLITLIGISWVPAILLTVAAIAVAGVLLMRVGPAAFMVWLRAEGLFIAGYTSGFLSAMATWMWLETKKPAMGWAALILLVVTIICFIRYTCRWNNWCAAVGPWWTARAWPAIRATWTSISNWLRGPFLHGVTVVAQTVWNALGFIAQNIQIVHVQWILLLVTGYGLYHSIFQGPLWISAWWWAALFAVAVLWISAEARTVVMAIIQRLWQAYAANWGRISLASTIMLIVFAGFWIWLCTHLLQMWKNNEVVVVFNKEYSIDLLGVGGVFLVGLLGWLLWQAFAGHGPRPPVLPQANRRGRRAGANP